MNTTRALLLLALIGVSCGIPLDLFKKKTATKSPVTTTTPCPPTEPPCPPTEPPCPPTEPPCPPTPPPCPTKKPPHGVTKYPVIPPDSWRVLPLKDDSWKGKLPPPVEDETWNINPDHKIPPIVKDKPGPIIEGPLARNIGTPAPIVHHKPPPVGTPAPVVHKPPHF